ncbi:GNAT family N-acetyltransferase, partial [Klebsiella pneumoniae]|nr:GNAT family N-acetyltransferase [Klebsiella pneumoniae]
GYGSEILQYLIQQGKVSYVDVNKDNERAIEFYLKNGFEVYKTSQTDAQGRNYPILHMKL